MGFELSDRELELFDRDGFVGPFDVYDGAEISNAMQRLRISLSDRSRAIYELEKGGNIANYDRHLDIPFLYNHVNRPQIVDRIRRILGPNLLCWRTEFFAKYPGDEGTDWHQSRNLAIGSGLSPLVGTLPHPKYPDIFLTLTVWTALTDATIENSCMQYIPGSHRELFYDDLKPLVWRPEMVNKVIKNGTKRGLFGYDTREILVNPDRALPESRAVNMELKAGQCVISWEATMHGSLPNRTRNRARLAVVARYVPTDVRIYPNQRTLQEYGGTADLANWHAVLVSGSDKFGFNRVMETPPADYEGNIS